MPFSGDISITIKQLQMNQIYRGEMVNVLDDDIVVSEFELQPCFYAHFWT